MGVLITTANFTGKYAIPQTAFSDLNSFITDTEEDYLISMLGAEFYTDFKANLVNKVPTSQKYLNIYNRFSKDYGCKVFKSRGMIEMLVAFIYFDYMRQVKYKPTTQGVVSNTSDTSKEVEYGNLYKCLNDATDSFNAIQAYIVLVNPNDYNASGSPVFNGTWRDYAIPIFM